MVEQQFGRINANMAKQNRQTNIWTAVVISAIVLAAIVMWAVVKRQPGEQAYHEHFPAPSESSDESAGNLNRPKISLNDVIRSARTWRPAYKSWYGKTAPDFTLTDLDGKEHKLSDYRGKDVMLVFWATWCRPCMSELPHLIALRNTVSEDELAMLAISYITTMPPQTTEIVKNFVEKNKVINYPVFSTDQRVMPAPFRTVGSIPCSFFIDPEGRIKLATEGLLTLGYMKAILQAE